MTIVRRDLSDTVTLYLGDCREVLPTLGRVDALIWDPPWGINFAEYNTHVDCAEDYPTWLEVRLNLAESLVDNGWCVVFQGARRAWEWARLVPREWRLLACAKNFTQMLPGRGPHWATDFALFWPVGEPEHDVRAVRDWHVAVASDFSTRPKGCLLYTSPSPRDGLLSRMPSSA